MGTREIKICENTGNGSDSDIRVCNRENRNDYGDIRICSSELDCSDPPVLSLSSGGGVAVVGSQYTASGGVLPYTFVFTDGTISDTGELLTINSCGGSGSDRTATVTVYDACGQSAALDIRLTGGSWVYDHTDTFGNAGCCENTDGVTVDGTYNRGDWTFTVGTVQYIEYWSYSCTDPLILLCEGSLQNDPLDHVIKERQTWLWKCP